MQQRWTWEVWWVRLGGLLNRKAFFQSCMKWLCKILSSSLKLIPLSLSLSLSLSVTQPDCKMWYMVSEAENVFYMESNFHYEVYGKTIKAIIKIRGHSSTLLLYISRFYSNFLLSSPKRDYKSGSYLTSVTSSTYTIRWDLLERRLCKLDG